MFNNQKSSYTNLIIIAVIVIAFMFNRLLGIAAALVFAACKLYSSRSAIIALKANRAFAQNKVEECIKLFEKAYNTKGCSFRNKNTYGYLQLKYGDIYKACEVYRGLLSEKLDENSVKIAKGSYSMVLWKQGKLDEAIDMLKEVYKTYKTSALYGTLGTFLIEKGNLEEAYEFILESYEYDDTDKVILDNLGQIYCLRGENQKAIEVFEKLMEQNPHFPEAYYDYGKVLMQEGKYERALELSKEALSKEFTNLSTIKREDIEKQIGLIESRMKE